MAVEVGVVGVGAGQGQGRVAAGRCGLFVAGRRRIGKDLGSERGAGGTGMEEDGVGGQVEGATSAAAAEQRTGGAGDEHRGGRGRRRRQERVVTDETLSVVGWLVGWLGLG